jgi:hypothetical protein
MVLALGLSFFAQAAQADWTPVKRLTRTSGDAYDPAAAVDSSGNVHVVWSEFSTESPDGQIYYRKSADGGATWIKSQRLSWTAANSVLPAIAVDSSDNLQVVWQDDTSGNYDIYYTRSTDGGATWATSQRLTWTPGISFETAIAVDSSGNLHVFWCDGTPGNNEIYYKRFIK